VQNARGLPHVAARSRMAGSGRGPVKGWQNGSPPFQSVICGGDPRSMCAPAGDSAPGGIVEELKRKAAKIGGTIVFPEPDDARIVQAAERIAAEGIAKPLLVGPPELIPDTLAEGVCAEPVEPSPRFEELVDEYSRRRGLKTAIARRLVRRPLIYGAMMVALGHADGMVGGIRHATARVLEAASLAIGYREGVTAPSSCFIMVVPQLGDRTDVPLIFADCAVNIDPTSEDLASIALAAADSARRFLGVVPRVAMLSFSTHGSASHSKVARVRRAVELAAPKLSEGYLDGELQLDTAIVPAVAAKKVTGDSEVAGRANVLVFPCLDAGNIAYKAVQHLAGASAIGPILLGFARPVNDLSRGADVADIVAVTAITVLQR